GPIAIPIGNASANAKQASQVTSCSVSTGCDGGDEISTGTTAFRAACGLGRRMGAAEACTSRYRHAGARLAPAACCYAQPAECGTQRGFCGKHRGPEHAGAANRPSISDGGAETAARVAKSGAVRAQSQQRFRSERLSHIRYIERL